MGLPYSSKSFEYSTGLGDDLGESETYLTKLGKARKRSYGSNWAFTPYFYSRATNWYGTDYASSLTSNNYNNLSVRIFIKNSSLY